tara:strand:- start:486 stop:1100 length:615 start_codon:yes stop_codon:yes gene_type:complete
MKLLREYIRSLLTEAAKGPIDLPDNWVVAHWSQRDDTLGIFIWEMSPNGKTHKRIAELWADKVERPSKPLSKFPEHELGPCAGAWEVVNASAPHGWGPMLYDIAMEYAGQAGLMSDRGTVSSDALGIWAYYDKRGDVTAFQLDNPANDLTPDIEDNCLQNAAEEYSSDSTNWMKSPLSRKYIKTNTSTIDALKKLGKWVVDTTK